MDVVINVGIIWRWVVEINANQRLSQQSPSFPLLEIPLNLTLFTAKHIWKYQFSNINVHQPYRFIYICCCCFPGFRWQIRSDKGWYLRSQNDLLPGPKAFLLQASYVRMMGKHLGLVVEKWDIVGHLQVEWPILRLSNSIDRSVVLIHLLLWWFRIPAPDIKNLMFAGFTNISPGHHWLLSSINRSLRKTVQSQSI